MRFSNTHLSLAPRADCIPMMVYTGTLPYSHPVDMASSLLRPLYSGPNNPLLMATLLIWPEFFGPLITGLTGVHCTYFIYSYSSVQVYEDGRPLDVQYMKILEHAQGCTIDFIQPGTDYKQLFDEVFVISGIIKVEVSIISRSRRLRLITLTEVLIISDITITESNNTNTNRDLDYFGYHKNRI